MRQEKVEDRLGVIKDTKKKKIKKRNAITNMQRKELNENTEYSEHSCSLLAPLPCIINFV